MPGLLAIEGSSRSRRLLEPPGAAKPPSTAPSTSLPALESPRFSRRRLLPAAMPSAAISAGPLVARLTSGDLGLAGEGGVPWPCSSGSKAWVPLELATVQPMGRGALCCACSASWRTCSTSRKAWRSEAVVADAEAVAPKLSSCSRGQQQSSKGVSRGTCCVDMWSMPGHAMLCHAVLCCAALCNRLRNTLLPCA